MDWELCERSLIDQKSFSSLKTNKVRCIHFWLSFMTELPACDASNERNGNGDGPVRPGCSANACS